MFCTKCGKALNGNVKFCPECGNMIKYQQQAANTSALRTEDHEVPMNSSAAATVKSPHNREYKQEQNVCARPKKVKKKMGRGKKTIIIIGVIMAVLLAMAITAFCILITSPAYGVWREIKKENYSEALSDYRSDVEDEFIQEIILEILLKEYDNKIFQKYQSGELQYVSAVEALELLDRLGVVGIEEKINNITELENANSAMQQGNQYYASGDYENAIQKYTAITESSDKYTEAQSKLNELYPKYIDAIVEKVKSYSSMQKYVDAIEYIDVSAVLIPANIDTAKLDQIRSECLYEYIVYIRDEVVRLVSEKQFTEAFAVIDAAIAVDDNEDFQNGKAMVETKYVESVCATVQKHLDSGYYSSAVNALNSALTVVPGNADLLALLVEVENEYVKSIIATAQEHLDNEDYISAARVVKNALTMYPENADLKNLQEKIERETPIYLLDVCKPYASSGYTEYVNGELVKMGGNSYTDAFRLSLNGYALFNVDSAYNTLSFVLGHCDGTDMGYATIKVYCDGILKKEITMDAEDLPQKITLDITGVDQLKFEADVRWVGECYAFANITVK